MPVTPADADEARGMSEHAGTVNDQRKPVSFEERRKGLRRSGIGRRIHGDRRSPLEPGGPEHDRSGLRKERRVFRRRNLPDRRSG
jgi:hypothetical protein